MEPRPERNIPQFNGDCYGAWKFRIKTVLKELQLYSLIESPPPENPDDEWNVKNTTAKCTIVNFLGNAFLHLAEGSSTAKSIIDSLDRLYERRNLTAQVALRKQLSDLKLLPNDSLSQHFSRFDKLISELISSGANIDEMDKVCQLLATLPSCYDGVIGPLEEFYGDNFNLAFVKTYLLDQEAKMEMETVTRLKHNMTEPAPNNTRKKPNNYNQYRNPQYPASHIYCDFCGRYNHFIQDCRFYNAQNGQAPPPGKRNRNIFPAMFPLCAPKIPKRLKKKTLINNTQHLRLNNINPYSVPNVKMNRQITVKEEPVVKQEPVEIKEEPVWVKQEPQWEDQPIKMETGTDNSTQGTMYVNMEPDTENSTQGTMCLVTESTQNSTHSTMYVKMEPCTESSMQGTVYLQVIRNREQFKNKKKRSKKRAQKRARQIAKLMMEAEKRTGIHGAEQQPITNSVQGS